MKGIRVLSYNHEKKKQKKTTGNSVGSPPTFPFWLHQICTSWAESFGKTQKTSGLLEESRWDWESSMMLWQAQRHTFPNINNGDNVPDFLGLLWGLMLREHFKNAVQALLINRQGESFGRLKGLELHPQGCLWIWE